MSMPLMKKGVTFTIFPISSAFDVDQNIPLTIELKMQMLVHIYQLFYGQ